MTLTFDPKNNRDPLLTKTNHPMKFEDCRSYCTPVIERNRSVTDGQMDGRVDGQGKKQYVSPRGRGGDIIIAH